MSGEGESRRRRWLGRIVAIGIIVVNVAVMRILVVGC